MNKAILLMLLFSVFIWAQDDCVPYNRSDYPHWVDADGDGLNTRHEVLEDESLDPVTIVSGRVQAGRWHCVFTDQEFTYPRQLDVDHMVPLKEAHESGAWRWSTSRKQGFSNYLRQKNHLVAVSASANRSKGDRDPAQWLPPNTAYRLQYVKDWADIKARWGLTADSAELVAMRETLGSQADVWLQNVIHAPEFNCDEGTASESALESPEPCCKRCNPGVSKACGDACIPVANNCTRESGCACDGQ